MLLYLISSRELCTLASKWKTNMFFLSLKYEKSLSNWKCWNIDISGEVHVDTTDMDIDIYILCDIYIHLCIEDRNLQSAAYFEIWILFKVSMGHFFTYKSLLCVSLQLYPYKNKIDNYLVNSYCLLAKTQNGLSNRFEVWEMFR